MARRSKGEGSLYQARDKTWIYQYIGEDGGRKTKRFRKKADARAYIESIRKAAQAPGEKSQAGGTTLSEWLDQWLELYARPTVKLSTYCSYEVYIRGHIRPQIGGLYLNTVTTDDLQRFFIERSQSGNLVDAKGLSPKTLANLRNMLHLAFAQAVKEKMILDNPVEGVRLPKAVRHEMRVLDPDEQNSLMQAARMAPEASAFGIIFDLFTGLRIGELCGLRWENVNMQDRSFKVCETRNRLPNHDPSIEASTSVCTVKTTKTDHSRRTVFLMEGLYKDFVVYHDIQMSRMKRCPGYNIEGYVFCQDNGMPYEPRTYQDLFKRCVKQAGIADANFHSLRHTFATRCLEQGMDVVALSKILGHAAPSITMDKYGHALNSHQRASVERLNKLYDTPEFLGADDVPQASATETYTVTFG